MSKLSTLLLKWYARNGRMLPWRGHPDAYAIWISEIMLQQTRVETVIPYFERWVTRFPTVISLAHASEQDVLTLWEGLGYYSRARNLHKAAKVIVEHHNGKLPRDLNELRALPGIGRYTVGAIASMAFGMDEPTLDGNLRRVFARLFDVTEQADLPAGEKILWELAAAHLPKGRAGDYNQALMDLGATICVPKAPRCLLCPLMNICKARQNGTQEIRPVLKAKKGTPHYIHAAAIVTKRGSVLLIKRPSKGLLGGMWEFPNARVAGEPAKELTKAINAAYSLKVKNGGELGVVSHAYTHFKITVHAFHCAMVMPSKNRDLKWVKIKQLMDRPMGKVDRQIANILKGL